MHLSTPAILFVALNSITTLVEACPFASSPLLPCNNNLPENHPPTTTTLRFLQEESLIGLDGNLVGSPSLDNGAFDFPSLLVPIRNGNGTTIADVVADMSTRMGEDMCLMRFQQLPPPAVGDYSFDQNATDRLALKYYGDLMVQRFSDLSAPDLHMGAIVHASTTVGFGGVQSFCNAGIEPERFCDETLLNANSLRWPQAVTGYKLTSETVQAAKDVVLTWRTTESGHLPSMTWSFLGGDPDNGGSQVGVWGNNGGLFSKIVRCSDIPTELMYYDYPDGIATSDFVDPTTNLTVSEMMYQWWTAYGGFDPETGEQVFGEAQQLPEECRPCVEATDCFGGRGCNVLDLETKSWGSPYEACGPAFGCLECFPGCLEEKLPAECAACAEAAPCFDTMGCASFDFENLTWASPYEDCSAAAGCLDCFPWCTPPPDVSPECVSCVDASPCFDELGCASFNSETKSWSAPYDTCDPALACVELGCFAGCDAEELEKTEAPAEAPTAAPTEESGAAAMSFAASFVVMATGFALLL